MARFEGAAAKVSDHMRLVARILDHEPTPTALLTPSERKAAAELLNSAMDWQKDMTKFLGDAPADAIIRCGCAGCEHIKDNLSVLRAMAIRNNPQPAPSEAELKAGYW